MLSVNKEHMKAEMQLIADSKHAIRGRFLMSRDLTTPFLGVVRHPWARTCYHDKATYQIWSLYLRQLRRYINGIKNVKNWRMVWGSYKNHSSSLHIAPFSSAYTSSYQPSIVTNYVPVLRRFWDTASEIYWSKIVDFNIPDLYLAPRSGWPHSGLPIRISREFWY